jgi:hypothetical protein
MIVDKKDSRENRYSRTNEYYKKDGRKELANKFNPGDNGVTKAITCLKLD